MINAWKIDYSAVHDGPGIKTSIHVKGCPLRCLWRSNPEGQTSEPHLVFIQSRRIDCGRCVGKCPCKAIDLQKDSETGNLNLQLNKIKCNPCRECISVCTPKALEELTENCRKVMISHGLIVKDVKRVPPTRWL